MMRRIAIGCLAMLVAGVAAPAKAGLMVYIQDTTVTAGSTAQLSVFIGSDNTPTFHAFSLFQIQLDSGATSPNQLGFTTNGSTAYLNQSASPGVPPYIFVGDSNDYGPPLYNPAFYPFPYGRPVAPAIDIGDSTATGSAYAPADNKPGDMLLAQVQIYALATIPGTYTVTLDTGANTFFYNGETQVGAEQGDATGYMGMITVLPASVPEPGSMILGMTAALLVAVFQGFLRHFRRPIHLSA